MTTAEHRREACRGCSVWRTVAERSTGRVLRDAPPGVLECAQVKSGGVRWGFLNWDSDARLQ